MRSFLDVSNDQIARMSPEEAVALFQQLLWGEASRLGIGINNINISRWIDVPDGGIDASVKAVPEGVSSGLLRLGVTGYQIKAGTSFKPWQDSQIQKELFGTKQPARENLGPSVLNCLEKGGTYVLVCFGHDLDDQKQRTAEDLLRAHFSTCGYPQTNVEVWSINQLIGFLRCFPSLRLRINRFDRVDFQAHESWSKNSDMGGIFTCGTVQQDVVEQIRQILRAVDSPVHLRVHGEPGIGKTRLLLEATSADDLKPLVLYFDSPEDFNGSSLLGTFLGDDSPCCAILVIDECDQRESSTLWNKLKSRSPRIKLVTIWCDDENTTGSTKHLSVPFLAQDGVSNIIQSYRIDRHKADRWAEFCSGSPRVAHIMGQNLKENPQDIMQSADNVLVWKRYIAGTKDFDDPEVRHRELVLQCLALFKRCGFEGPVRGESQIVGKIVEKIDPQVNFLQFRRVVEELRSRGIVKGSKTIHISPKLLHVKLWGDWWDSYGDDFEKLVGHVGKLPADLRKWFYEMFEYGAGFDSVCRIAKSLLAEDGILKTIQDLENPETARFFSALVSAAPKAALECLKRTVGKCNRQELDKFVAGRREVIWALEKIAVWRELFLDGATLLLRLAEAENETWSNNASGVFADLFTPAPGAVAPTEASPQERLPLLIEAMDSDSKEIRLLAIQACDKALESDHFSRFGTPHYQGLQKDAKLWMPVTWNDLFDYYGKIWDLLWMKHEALPNDEREKAIDVLLNRSMRLIRFVPLAEKVTATLEEMGTKSFINRKRLLREIINILHSAESLSLRAQCRDRLERLRDDLTSGFSSQLLRHVGMRLIEDHYDKDGNSVDTGRQNIAALARQAASAPELLNNDLAWLVSREAENAFWFGYELAKFDADFTILPQIIEANCATIGGENTDFLCGYLSWIFETEPSFWEKKLESLIGDERINRKLPEITLKSGASDESALRILHLMKSGIIGVADFWVFRYRSSVNHMSESVFEQIVDVLLADPSSFAASTALDLVDFRYCRRKAEQQLPETLAYRVLTHPGFFHKPETGRRDQMDEFRWKDVASSFVRLYPDRSIELADHMLISMGQDGAITENLYPNPLSVLDEITKTHPSDMWNKLSAYLVIPNDLRSWSIASWLQGRDRRHDPDMKKESRTALEFVPLELIWAWIDEDVENRAWYFADLMVPKTLFREQGRQCLARAMLVRYGHLESVRSNFGSNFISGGWSGPSSLHWAEQKQLLEDFKKTEDNQKVRQWIDEQITWLDEQIERARVEEEREYFV
ncbi:MAG: ATP-binding protein [Desulfomonile tiedjei]|uniref:ATP-binding protein n=1 Tax=Desulfomonile tiedjei TaxID=2358 RepID=A0A9D6V5E3_9BACT|nr:ATP-binding protein [Desulfomonile tiedjei]